MNALAQSRMLSLPLLLAFSVWIIGQAYLQEPRPGQVMSALLLSQSLLLALSVPCWSLRETRTSCALAVLMTVLAALPLHSILWLMNDVSAIKLLAVLGALFTTSLLAAEVLRFGLSQVQNRNVANLVLPCAQIGLCVLVLNYPPSLMLLPGS